jgi:PHD/YefM family antitoxin component YafN of YafNO toxin-antitoxin module
MAKTIELDVTDIRSVTDFQRNVKTHITRLRRTKSPMVLTVNGAASIVVQDAVAYQTLVDENASFRAAQEFIVAINEGIAAADRGDVVSLRSLKRR